MITVTVIESYPPATRKKELALIRIEPVEADDDSVRYIAEFVVERGGATGLHSRVFEMITPEHANILALIKAALESLDDQALESEKKHNG